MASKPQPQTVSVVFEKEKDTKNTVRFQELVEEGGTPVIGMVYVRKEAFSAMGEPATIRGNFEAVL